MVVHIVHGINLGQLGTRQPEVYGTLRLEDQLPVLQSWLDAHFGGTELRSFQSDDEGALCAYLAAHNGSDHAFVINPGASPTPPSPCATPSPAYRAPSSKCT